MSNKSVWTDVNRMDKQQRERHKHYLLQKIQARRIVQRSISHRERSQLMQSADLTLTREILTLRSRLICDWWNTRGWWKFNGTCNQGW